MTYYEGNDKNKWRVDFDETNFKQSRCYFEDRPVLMMKARATLSCPVDNLFKACIDDRIRQQWDPNVADYKLYYEKQD